MKKLIILIFLLINSIFQVNASLNFGVDNTTEQTKTENKNIINNMRNYYKNEYTNNNNLTNDLKDKELIEKLIDDVSLMKTILTIQAFLAGVVISILLFIGLVKIITLFLNKIENTIKEIKKENELREKNKNFYKEGDINNEIEKLKDKKQIMLYFDTKNKKSEIYERIKILNENLFKITLMGDENFGCYKIEKVL